MNNQQLYFYSEQLYFYSEQLYVYSEQLYFYSEQVCQRKGLDNRQGLIGGTWLNSSPSTPSQTSEKSLSDSRGNLNQQMGQIKSGRVNSDQGKLIGCQVNSDIRVIQ